MSAFLQAKFLRVCPYGKQRLQELVDNCKKEMFRWSVLVILLILLWNGIYDFFSVIYLLESIVLAIYLICMGIPNYRLQKIENRVYRELLLYFSRVKHCYMTCHHIANAVMEAAGDMQYEIQRLAGELYQVLMESDRKEKVREYITLHRTNRYLKLFLIQAYEVSEKGDICFEENVEHLRLELMEEIYRRKRRAHEFAGYVFVTVVPFFMMPVLKQWGLDFMPELELFYAGTGAFLETVTFCATILIYGMIMRAKEIVFFTGNAGEKLWNPGAFYEREAVNCLVQRFERAEGNFSRKIRRLLLQAEERTSYGRFCFRILLVIICSFLVLTLFGMEAHRRERSIILTTVDSIDVIAPVASEEKREALEMQILSVTNQCKGRKNITEEEIRTLLREELLLENKNIEQAAVEEIMERLIRYKKARGSVGEVLLCLLGSFCVGLLPILKLFYQAKTIRSGAVYEVHQFQTIILMERKLPGITVMGLLEDMEVFSKCFRGCLRKCINSYGAGARAALMRLKEEGCELHEGMEELADAFLSVDEVGIELAFAEVESNRRLLEKMTQLEAEISMERKKDSTDLLAKIPMVLAVGAYFILPFFYYSLQGVYEVFKLLEESQL